MKLHLYATLVLFAIALSCAADPYLSKNLTCVELGATRAQIDACRALTRDGGVRDGTPARELSSHDAGKRDAELWP